MCDDDDNDDGVSPYEYSLFSMCMLFILYKLRLKKNNIINVKTIVPNKLNTYKIYDILVFSLC